MALCKVTGTLYLPTGARAGDYAIFLQRTDKRVAADYLGSVVPQMVRVLTSQTGTVNFDILTGTYRGVARPSNMAGTAVGYEFSFAVPDAATAQFKNCIDAIAPAQPTPPWLQRVEDAVAAADQAASAASSAAGQAAGVVAIAVASGAHTLSNISGTANAITADLPVGITPANGMNFIITPASTNIGPATVTFGGVTYAVQNGNAALTGGELLAGAPVMVRRVTGSVLRLVGATTGQVNAMESRVAVFGLHTLTDITGTGDSFTGTLATATDVDGVQFVAQIPSDNITTLPRITFNGGTARTILRNDGSVIEAGDLRAGEFVVLRRVGTQFRIVGTVRSQRENETGSYLGRITTVAGSSAAGRRTLDAAAYAVFPVRVRFDVGTVLSGIPIGAKQTLTEAADLWTTGDGGALIQHYREGAGKYWTRTRGASAWSAWTVGTLRLTNADTSAATRSFNAGLLLTAGLRYQFDGTATISNGPDGNKSYSGYAEVDMFGGQIRQRLWQTGDPLPFTRLGGAAGAWVRSVQGMEGSTAVFVGDSITHGVGTVTPATEAFPVIAARRLGCALVKIGTAGAQMDSTTAATQQQKDGSFVEVVTANAAVIAAASRLVVAFGTNDFNRSTPIGTLADTARGTFLGAMRDGLAAALAANPAVKLVFCTPLYRSISATDAGENLIANGVGHTLEDYRAAIRSFALRYGYPVIEGRAEMGMNALNVLQLTTDGLHPNAAGARLWGEAVGRRLS